jgi:hypothetical protein
MKSLKRLFIFLLVLVLGGGIVFLLSERNARTYTTEIVDGKLVVLKGRMFPIGAEAYRPADPILRDAYAPISLDGTSPGDLTQRQFIEREELDRALFDLVARLARARITSDEPSVLEQGVYFLRRAEKFSGLTEEQRRSIQDMQLEVAFYLARTKLDEARARIEEGLAQLRIAAGTQNRHAHAANQMILEVEPAAKGLEEALRRAAHVLSAPSPASAGEPPRVPAPADRPAPSPPSGTGEKRNGSGG